MDGKIEQTGQTTVSEKGAHATFRFTFFVDFPLPITRSIEKSFFVPVDRLDSTFATKEEAAESVISGEIDDFLDRLEEKLNKQEN